MVQEDGQPSRLKKEEWLKEIPVFQNKVLCEKIFHQDFTMSQLHLHEFVEISIAIKGRGVHRIWNEALECKKGDICALNVGVPHEYFSKSGEEPLVVWNLLFDAGDWFQGELASSDSPRFCYGIFNEDILSARMSLKNRSLETVERIYRSIEKETVKKQQNWMDAVRAQLTLLLVTMGRCLEESRIGSRMNPKDKILVSTVMRIVMERYCEKELTLEAIADSLYLSKSYLSKIFFRVTGEHFFEYLRSVRLQQACRLLTETAMTNEQIVYGCGLKDVPSFYRLFRNNFSMTPNQYRMEARKNGEEKKEMK